MEEKETIHDQKLQLKFHHWAETKIQFHLFLETLDINSTKLNTLSEGQKN